MIAGAQSASDKPRVSLTRRIWFSVAIGIAAICLAAIRIWFMGGLSDFGPVWYGAYSILHGIDPYATFGPGLATHYDWHLYYPMPAMIAALPFGFFSEPVAMLVFAGLASGLLAFAITRDNWDRAWIFFSASFITAARSAQWGPLILSAFLIPSLGFFLICKPSLGSAVAISTESRKTLLRALIGGGILTLISFLVLPSWPAEWWHAVRTGTELNPPITRGPGFLVVLALLRWRQPEARLLLAVACVPQTSSWYETLLPLIAARSKREMQILVFGSGVGYLAQIAVLDSKHEIASTDIGLLMVVFVYLPALAVVLNRPNVGILPAWLDWMRSRR